MFFQALSNVNDGNAVAFNSFFFCILPTFSDFYPLAIK